MTSQSYLGDLGSRLFEISQEGNVRKWSFPNRSQTSAHEWRTRAREIFLEKLSFSPQPVPLDSRIIHTEEFPGYTQQWIDFSGTSNYRITAVILIPDRGRPPFPAVIGLHDHGGFFYYGKEKIVETKNSLPVLQARKDRIYGGRSWASELARDGYIVLASDSLGWGVRNIKCPDQSDPFSYTVSFENEQNIDEINAEAASASGFLDLHASFAGISWAGIVSWDDRRSVDYLFTREEVDPQRIACVGLSGGGFRSTYLFGSDARITCAGIIGWMSCLSYQLIHENASHLGLFTAPAVYREMDHCDIALLGAPKPLYVQQCIRDNLYPLEAMQKSCEHIEKGYRAFHAADKFKCGFYDYEHCFNLEMQKDMFAWLESVLK